ncbi:hypothetical protein [Nocardia shimofusensis]|uniref:hypothetical protein n=1 Tax=Nocardia shimofusensis TaxID=228596 RepID=UPI000ACE915E|nr:hypothetical protein [Nocardia shimofusensis]
MTGVAAAALMMAAPQATALDGVYEMALSGADHAVGCTYELSIVDPPSPASATFFDNGRKIGASSGSSVLTGDLETRWTPETAGTHNITASLGYLSAAVFVTPLVVEVREDGSCGGGGLSSILPSFSG